MHGFLLLDKPQGITSFKAAGVVRRLLSEKRIGHTGTLDPMATGVLPLLLGQATRLSSYLIAADKRYTARLKFGLQTDTLDITGSVTNTAAVNVDEAAVLVALDKFRGEISQIPPMYSAIRKDGVRLYDLARQGKEVEREPRTVTIRELILKSDIENNEIEIDVLCTKGTYIRTLIDDIGKELGCFATMTALRRTMTAGFDIADCVPLETLETNGAEIYVLPPDHAVMNYDSVTVSDAQGVRFTNGGELDLVRLTLPKYDDGALFRVYGKGRFLGLGKVDAAKGQLKVVCVIGGFL